MNGLVFLYCLTALLVCYVEAHGNCSEVCLEDMARLRLEDIKMRLLSSIGLREPPNIDNIGLPPSAIQAGFQAMIGGIDDEDDLEEHEKTFIIAVDPSEGTDRSTLVARFPVTVGTMQRSVSKAHLHVFLYVSDPLEEEEEITIVVRERLLNGELGDVVATKKTSIMKSGKVSITLQPFDVERWWNSQPVLGLYVEAILNGENIVVHPQQDRHPRHTMFLAVDLMSATPSRQRRSSPVCTTEDKEQGCCLYNLIVDFEQIGWKFILAPSRYNAYMCRGDCAYNHAHMSRHGHTKLAKGTQITRGEAVGHQGMCCHPSEYDSVKLIYMSSDKQITMVRVPGMIARKCSCS